MLVYLGSRIQKIVKDLKKQQLNRYPVLREVFTICMSVQDIQSSPDHRC